MGDILNTAKILAADDLPLVRVPVPEWGGDVFLKTWSAGDRDAFEASLFNADGAVSREGYRARAVMLSLVDVDGARMFDADDFAKLQAKSAKVIDALFKRVDAMNAVSADEQDDAAGN